MDKKLLGITAGVVVVASVGIYVLSGRDASGISVSMEDYVHGRLGNAHCTLSMNEQGGQVDAELYISGLRMRMEHTVTHQGGTMKSYLVNDGENVYIWGNGSAISMKYDPEAVAADGAFGAETDEQLADILSNDMMKCTKWNVDESLLKKPADVQFMDITNGLDFGDMYETIEGGAAPTEPESLDVTPEEAQKLLQQLQESGQMDFGEHYPDLTQ